jgi:small subunit ribosomal protein S21
LHGKASPKRLGVLFLSAFAEDYRWGGALAGSHIIKRDDNMKVTVHDNQIEKALRDLKKKLTKEGFFSEIKERRFYDKPSVQKKKKRAKAAKRRRKRMKRFY